MRNFCEIFFAIRMSLRISVQHLLSSATLFSKELHLCSCLILRCQQISHALCCVSFCWQPSILSSSKDYYLSSIVLSKIFDSFLSGSVINTVSFPSVILLTLGPSVINLDRFSCEKTGDPFSYTSFYFSGIAKLVSCPPTCDLFRVKFMD